MAKRHYALSASARIDLNGIWDHIAADSPAAADRLVANILAACERLGQFPLIGIERRDLNGRPRYFPVGNYLIFYQPQGRSEANIEIARVLHGARDIRAILG